jgi:hypothetical protein
MDPLHVGADVAEVPVHVQQLPIPQERHDLGKLPLDCDGFVSRVLSQPVRDRVWDVFAEKHQAARGGGQRFETGPHGRGTALGGDGGVDVGVFGGDRRPAR